MVNRQAVSTDQAPAALGPYSQAIVAGGIVFCSGTAGIDPATGAAPDGIDAQTDQALRNLAAVLASAGATMADVVKTTIFYADVEAPSTDPQMVEALSAVSSHATFTRLLGTYASGITRRR